MILLAVIIARDHPFLVGSMTSALYTVEDIEIVLVADANMMSLPEQRDDLVDCPVHVLA